VAQPGGRELFGAPLGVAPSFQGLQGMLLRRSTDIYPKELARDMREFFNSLLRMAEREIHRPGRKKRVRKAEAEVDPEFQIAPMIDILLVLLVFFMSISSTEMLQSNQDVDLPVAREAKESKKNPGQVIVNVLYNAINNQTVIEVDERGINLGQLAPMLQAKVGANPFVRVLVRADKEVRYEFMRGLLEAVGKSGVGNVTFSVADKER
jgi:biopolymer transport protein ExbD